MGFLGLNLFSKNSDKGNTYLSLAVTSDKILATVWELEGETVKQVGFAHKSFHNIDSLIHEAAIAIDTAAQKAQADVTEAVFGLSNYWLEDGKLSKETANILKDLSDDLELEPQAFVSIASSLNHYLKIKDNKIPDNILICTLGDFTEVHLLSENKVKITKIHKGEASIEKINQLLFEIKTESGSLLPQNFLIYGSRDDSHLVKQLKSHKSEGLLKGEVAISIIDDEEVAKSVAFSQAADVLGHDPVYSSYSLRTHPVVGTEDIKQEEEVPPEEDLKEENDSQSEDDFGFQEDKDVLKTEKPQEVAEQKEAKDQEYAVEVENIKPTHGYESPKERLEETEKTHKKSLFESIFTLSYLSKFTNILGSQKSSKKLFVLAGGVLALTLAVLFFASLTLVNAEVIIKANSKPLEDQFLVTVASGASLDTTRERIPGEEIISTATGNESAATTGKKKTGTNAKGEVKVFNWTTSEVTFPQGTVLISKNGIKFKLDSEVKIASRSASLPGEANSNATAQEIGTSGNVDGSVDFTFQQYDELLYSGKSNAAFTGGEEKEVQTVAQADMDKLEKSLTEDLTKKAKEDIVGKLSGQNVEEDAVQVVVIKKQFDKVKDEEATTFNLSMEVEAKALVYKEEVLRQLIAQMAQEQSGDNLESLPENVDIANLSIKRNKDTLTLNGDYKANLVPKINEDDIKGQIAGKGQKEAREIIKQVGDIQEVEFRLSPNLVLFTSLPKQQNKIKLKIEAIR